MLNVFICDDEKEILDFISKEIENQIIIQNYDMKIISSTINPKNLIDNLKKSQSKRNLYFLDVEFKNSQYDGFALGKEIRKIDPNGTIVYITSYKDLAYKTFQYHLEAFDYIIKDTDKKLRESICDCLKSIIESMVQETIDPSEFYTFKTGERLCHIPLDEIDYFETSPRSHYVVLHAKHDRKEFIGNLSDIEKQLFPRFLKIHRSYLVALDKIDQLDLKNNQVCIEGNVCLVSRKMKSKLLKEMNRIR